MIFLQISAAATLTGERLVAIYLLLVALVLVLPFPVVYVTVLSSVFLLSCSSSFLSSSFSSFSFLAHNRRRSSTFQLPPHRPSVSSPRVLYLALMCSAALLLTPVAFVGVRSHNFCGYIVTGFVNEGNTCFLNSTSQVVLDQRTFLSTQRKDLFGQLQFRRQEAFLKGDDTFAPLATYKEVVGPKRPKVPVPGSSSDHISSALSSLSEAIHSGSQQCSGEVGAMLMAYLVAVEPHLKQPEILIDRESFELVAMDNMCSNNNVLLLSADDALKASGSGLIGWMALFAPGCGYRRVSNDKEYITNIKLKECPEAGLFVHLSRNNTNLTKNSLPIDLGGSEIVCKQSDTETHVYSLEATAEHSGGVGGGHYTSYVALPNGHVLSANDSWLSTQGTPSTTGAVLARFRRVQLYEVLDMVNVGDLWKVMAKRSEADGRYGTEILYIDRTIKGRNSVLRTHIGDLFYLRAAGLTSRELNGKWLVQVLNRHNWTKTQMDMPDKVPAELVTVKESTKIHQLMASTVCFKMVRTGNKVTLTPLPRQQTAEGEVQDDSFEVTIDSAADELETAGYAISMMGGSDRRFKLVFLGENPIHKFKKTITQNFMLLLQVTHLENRVDLKAAFADEKELSELDSDTLEKVIKVINAPFWFKTSIKSTSLLKSYEVEPHVSHTLMQFDHRSLTAGKFKVDITVPLPLKRLTERPGTLEVVRWENELIVFEEREGSNYYSMFGCAVDRHPYNFYRQSASPNWTTVDVLANFEMEKPNDVTSVTRYAAAEQMVALAIYRVDVGRTMFYTHDMKPFVENPRIAPPFYALLAFDNRAHPIDTFKNLHLDGLLVALPGATLLQLYKIKHSKSEIETEVAVEHLPQHGLSVRPTFRLLFGDEVLSLDDAVFSQVLGHNEVLVGLSEEKKLEFTVIRGRIIFKPNSSNELAMGPIQQNASVVLSEVMVTVMSEGCTFDQPLELERGDVLRPVRVPVNVKLKPTIDKFSKSLTGRIEPPSDFVRFLSHRFPLVDTAEIKKYVDESVDRTTDTTWAGLVGDAEFVRKLKAESAARLKAALIRSFRTQTAGGTTAEPVAGLDQSTSVAVMLAALFNDPANWLYPVKPYSLTEDAEDDVVSPHTCIDTKSDPCVHNELVFKQVVRE
eukprot:GHVS01108969.1.p1 GENE.GHVS01108969.1~~GHVS01108969.1.p1  ORF type:complete len:1138 (+),score=132.90 GHVS01108969.1:104-3517(+)